jgi:hypothetical protein
MKEAWGHKVEGGEGLGERREERGERREERRREDWERGG